MSLAACWKEILCDPDVSEAQAIANAENFLMEQSKAQYGNDPTEVLRLKRITSDAARPHLKDGIKAAVKAADENIQPNT